MYPDQQRELIHSQVAQILESDDLKVIPQPNPLELHLNVAAVGGRRYHLKLDLENYDLEPPKLYVLDEQGNVTWDRKKLPPWPFLNGSRHPGANRDFFCIAGTYDYHSHPLHEHEPWDALRNTTPLAALASKLSKTLKEPPAPKLTVGINGLGNLPLRHILLQFTNGENYVFEVNGESKVVLQGLEITFANNQILRIEARNAT